MSTNEETPMTATKPAQPTIAELAQWPETEEAVTVAAIRRSLLVWAKVYECRLWDNAGRVLTEPVTPESAQRSGDLAAAFQYATMAGLLLGQLEQHDPAAALVQARLYWRGSEDGETVADALLEALDSIDRELAEAVVVAYEEATTGGAA